MLCLNEMPASSGMIIFISESFQSVLGWMRSHQNGGLLSSSPFFPGVALFPREGTHRSKPLGALGAASIPGRNCLPLLPPVPGEHELVLKGKRYESPCSTSVLCGFLRASIELHSPLLVGFFVVVFISFFKFFHQIWNWNHQFISLTISFSTQVSNNYLS